MVCGGGGGEYPSINRRGRGDCVGMLATLVVDVQRGRRGCVLGQRILGVGRMVCN